MNIARDSLVVGMEDRASEGYRAQSSGSETGFCQWTKYQRASDEGACELGD